MKALERRLGLVGAISVSLGAMLGSGLFVLPGLATAKTGPSVWLAYAAAGLCVLPAALSKSELATAMPAAGGTFVYLDRAFGPLAGTVAGLGLWLSLLLKSAFALVGFGAYLNVMAPIPIVWAGLGALVLVVAMNVRGTGRVGQLLVVVLGVAFAALTTMAGFGLARMDRALFDPFFAEGAGGFVAAVAFVYIAYAGVTKVAAVAEEIDKPEKNLPRSILLSLLLAGLLYVAVTAALVGNVPESTLHDDTKPVHSLAMQLGGPALGLAAAALAVLTMTSMANAGLLAASRFPFAMARHDLLPELLARVSSSSRTPVPSVLITGGLMALAIVFLKVGSLAKLASSFQVLVLTAECVAVMLLRESRAKWYQPSWNLRPYPLVPLIGIAIGILLLIALGVAGLIAALTVAVPGAGLFLVYGRRRTDRRGVFRLLGPRPDLVAAPERSPAPETLLPKQARAVVVLSGNESSPEGLVEVAVGLAGGGPVVVVHLTDVPEQAAIEVALEEEPLIHSLRRRFRAMAEERGFDIRFDPVVTRDAARTTRELTHRLGCSWLVMEWPKRTARRVLLLHPLTWLLHHLPCRVALFRDVGVRHAREFLVLVEPGPHDVLVLRTAEQLAGLYGATLTLATYAPNDLDGIELQRRTDYLDQVAQLGQSEGSLTRRIVRGRRQSEAIAAETPAFDLLVLGVPPHVGPWRAAFGTEADRLIDRAACDVLYVRTPRALPDERLVPGEPRPAEGPMPETRDALLPECVQAGLTLRKKEAVFSHAAKRFAEALPDLDAATIESALWDRERTQNTSVGMGIALPHATLPVGDRPRLGVFTTSEPLDYQAPDGEPVDVLLVTLAPPQARRAHLELLAFLSRCVLRTTLLEELRAAEDDEAARHATRHLREAELDEESG